MEMPVTAVTGTGGNIELADTVFDRPFNEGLVHQIQLPFARIVHEHCNVAVRPRGVRSIMPNCSRKGSCLSIRWMRPESGCRTAKK